MDHNTETETADKKTIRTDEQKRSLINRLKRIEGQIRGLEKLIENDVYCNDILQQSAAAAAAINAFNKELLSDHIHGCITREIRAGNDDVVDELTATIHKLMK